MGLMSNIRKLSSSSKATEPKQASPVETYEAQLSNSADGESAEDKTKRERELDMFQKMDKKEKERWVKHKTSKKWSSTGKSANMLHR